MLLIENVKPMWRILNYEGDVTGSASVVAASQVIS